jgi:hypothetical protein
MTNETNLSELVFPGLKAIWGLSYPQYKPEWSQVFPTKPTSQQYEKTLGMAGFGLPPVKPEGVGVAYDDPYQGPTHSLYQAVRALGFIVTKEMYTDDQYCKINALPTALKYSMIQGKEWDHWNIFNNAFTSGLGADAVYLCSASHTYTPAGTWSNMPSVACDLSLTALEQAVIDIGAFLDPRGVLKMNLRPMKLVVSTSDDWTARQLLGSEKDPETPASNAINPARGMFPQGHMVGHFLTDPDAWFILTDCQNGLVSYAHSKWGLQFTKDNDFGSDNALQKATDRYVAGWDDPRAIYGSSGA